jgi:thioredoxin 1
MTMTTEYAATEPAREHLDQTPGPLLVEFGAPWCPICQAAQPVIAAALSPRADLPHLKIEDGKGKPLGRSFRIKLWPTLVLLEDGREVGRVVRPAGRGEIEELLSALAGPA